MSSFKLGGNPVLLNIGDYVYRISETLTIIIPMHEEYHFHATNTFVIAYRIDRNLNVNLASGFDCVCACVPLDCGNLMKEFKYSTADFVSVM